MKAMKYLSMLLMMVAMSVSFSSCGDDEDPVEEIEEFSLAGTRWTYTDKYEDDGVEYTYDYVITFTSTTATYQMTLTVQEGSQTQTASDYVNYTYVYEDGLVVFTPTTAGKAYLEGEISSGIKMTVVNTSTHKTIGVFYKQ